VQLDELILVGYVVLLFKIYGDISESHVVFTVFFTDGHVLHVPFHLSHISLKSVM
jgi:hypothetical protein